MEEGGEREDQWRRWGKGKTNGGGWGKGRPMEEGGG